MCWFVQVSAVDAKHASADYDRFDCLVRDSWDVVKDHLRVNVRVWKRLTAEQQTRHLLNKSSPPLEQGQAEELAQEINGTAAQLAQLAERFTTEAAVA